MFSECKLQMIYETSNQLQHLVNPLHIPLNQPLRLRVSAVNFFANFQ